MSGASLDRKLCFFIAPIGDEDSEVRKRSDQVLKHIVEPPAQACGYEVVRADRIEKPGIITSQVIECVLEYPLVIADLTGRNPNVFYELALRHVIRKPYIQLIQKGEPLPFDVAGIRTIPVDHRDLDSVEECRQAIIAQIRSLEEKPGDVESPVSVAVQIKSLRESDRPVEQSLAEIREQLAVLVRGIEKQSTSLSFLHPRRTGLFGVRGFGELVERRNQQLMVRDAVREALQLYLGYPVQAESTDEGKPTDAGEVKE